MVTGTIVTKSLPPSPDKEEDESNVESEEADSDDTDDEDDHDGGVVPTLSGGWGC